MLRVNSRRARPLARVKGGSSTTPSSVVSPALLQNRILKVKHIRKKTHFDQREHNLAPARRVEDLNH